ERARMRGDHPYLFHEGRRITYREFDALTNQAAHALIELGVRRGDRVTVAMGNSIDYLLAAFGALKAGAIYHPINASLGGAEISYILGHAEPRLIIPDHDNLPHLRAANVTLPDGATLATFA